MRVFQHPQRPALSREALADRVVWALIAGVAVVNVLLMWRIASAGT